MALLAIYAGKQGYSYYKKDKEKKDYLAHIREVRVDAARMGPVTNRALPPPPEEWVATGAVTGLQRRRSAPTILPPDSILAIEAAPSNASSTSMALVARTPLPPPRPNGSLAPPGALKSMSTGGSSRSSGSSSARPPMPPRLAVVTPVAIALIPPAKATKVPPKPPPKPAALSPKPPPKPAALSAMKTTTPTSSANTTYKPPINGVRPFISTSATSTSGLPPHPQALLKPPARSTALVSVPSLDERRPSLPVRTTTRGVSPGPALPTRPQLPPVKPSRAEAVAALDLATPVTFPRGRTTVVDATPGKLINQGGTLSLDPRANGFGATTKVAPPRPATRRPGASRT